MAEETDQEHGASVAGGSVDPLAAQIAMNASSETAADAREYLRKQNRVADLQIERMKAQDDHIEEEQRHQLSHLRFRHFSDWAKFALEISAALIAMLVVTGIATMVWNASRSRDLVVEPFSVPADVVQSGMTGSVLAARVLDRMGAMQASSTSLAEGAGSYRSDDRDKVRVEIPDTGISIGELNRYLRQWLGDDIAVGGDLVHTPKGSALTIRYGDRPGSTVFGGDLDKLIDQAAERLFRAARPLRYVDYLAEHGRFAEGESILAPLTVQGGARARALAYITLASLHYEEGDTRRELEAATIAARLDPSNAAAWYALDAAAFNLSHRQPALDAEETVLSLIASGRASDLNPDMATTMPAVLGADRAIDKGDPAGAIAACQAAPGVADCRVSFLAGYEIDAHDDAEARRFIATLPATRPDGKPSTEIPLLQAALARREGDWARAIAMDKTAEALLANQSKTALHIELWPRLAYTMARAGDIAGAQAVIAKTGLDCDVCVIERGRIAALTHNWPAAQRWFALVSARMPSMPYADAAWGEMLLAKGDLDAAIAKFTLANQKGPHFADPLEMWGEALMLKNRSDLALAKFENANKYAPNWGRLHMKWGEALGYVGRKDDARAQYRIASTLDLSVADKAELARDIRR